MTILNIVDCVPRVHHVWRKRNRIHMGERNRIHMGERNRIHMGERNRIHMGERNRIHMGERNRIHMGERNRIHMGERNIYDDGRITCTRNTCSAIDQHTGLHVLCMNRSKTKHNNVIYYCICLLNVIAD